MHIMQTTPILHADQEHIRGEAYISWYSRNTVHLDLEKTRSRTTSAPYFTYACGVHMHVH